MYEHCTAEVKIEVKTGQRIATAGGIRSAALDFASADRRIPAPYVANPNHLYALTAACAIDYYQEPVRSQLQALVGDGQVNGRHVPKGCGTIFQDVKGTLQGNWFYGTPSQANYDPTRQLALLHDNFDPSMDLIAMGGTVAGRSMGSFAPTHEGVVHREFSEVVPSDLVYCYPSFGGGGGRVLMQLVSDTEMRIEAQAGECSAGLAFVNPFSYQR